MSPSSLVRDRGGCMSTRRIRSLPAGSVVTFATEHRPPSRPATAGAVDAKSYAAVDEAVVAWEDNQDSVKGVRDGVLTPGSGPGRRPQDRRDARTARHDPRSRPEISGAVSPSCAEPRAGGISLAASRAPAPDDRG